ncbi:MAG: class I SAM-dependent methyltransferase [Chloroflexi bacterium]|nr:class I SAM-dependent methyltransferase [Chloroflexota bacterium]
MTSRQGAARAVFQALPLLLLEAAVLALHFAVTRGSAWHEPVLILLAFPVLLATVGGVRTAAPALVLPAVALADDVANGEPAAIVFEALFLLALTATGLLIARGVDVERADLDRVLTETRERAARLKDTSGLWQNVALTRMGAYTTSVEEAFLDEACRARPGGIVVDVGSAGGRLEHVLTRHADHVIATDLDRDEVYAMAEDPKVTPVLVGALPVLPVRDDAVDAVVAIEAPAASDQAWFREECRRVLRPGGVVLLTMYNARSYKSLFTRIRRRLRRSGTLHWDDLYYQRSTAEQIQLWRAAGFQPGLMQGYYWPPLRRRSNSRWVAAGSAIERLLGLRTLVGISPCVLVELRRTEPTSRT